MNDVKTLGAIVVVLMTLQACSSQVPASNAGPGFNDYSEYELDRARRENELNGTATATFEAPAQVQTGVIGSSDLAAAGIGQSQTSAPMSAMSNTAIAAAPAADNVGISDEQDFNAVASRESIQSDAQRRAAQAASREQILPGALPTRTGNEGVNIVQYALNAPNSKGQEWYSRSIFATKGRFERNCVKYGSADAAQRDFLASGGPERDRKGIDPDGDGFACGWDPAPFLLAAGR